jgi:hypothetical protein
MKRKMSLTNARIVGKICLLCLVVIVVNSGGSTAFALDPMGPPLSVVFEGQFRAGADLTFGKMDIELSNGKWVESAAGVVTDAGDAINFTLKDFETTKLYGTIGYGIAENWEAFVRIGAAKAEFGDSIWRAGEDFDSGIDLAVGGGIKAMFFEIPELDLQIGGLVQVNWSSFDGKLGATSWSAPDFVEVSLAEAQIAVGATYTWTDSISVYGGPFIHYIRGDVEDIFANSVYSWDIDEGPIFGGYLGGLVEIADNCLFHVEYQYSSNANALAAGLAVSY